MCWKIAQIMQISVIRVGHYITLQTADDENNRSVDSRQRIISTTDNLHLSSYPFGAIIN